MEYGSDLPLDHYEAEIKNQTSERVSLSKVSQMNDSLLQIVKTKAEAISGIVVPWAYVGGHFSSFCWHTEDLFLYSVNYMHEGGTKTWYGVPYSDVEKTRNFLREKYKDQLEDRPSLLNEVLISFSPLELVKQGVNHDIIILKIKVYKLNQKPGEMIVTLPGVYHAGFSNSFNLAEAVNLATSDWIETAWKFKEMDKNEGFIKRACFPVDWIIYESFLKRYKINLSEKSRQTLEKEFNDLVKREIAKRNQIREKLEILDEVIVNGSQIKYFDYTCERCKNYLYLSWLGCSKCLKLYCVSHEHACSCEEPEIYLFKRVEDKELTSLVV